MLDEVASAGRENLDAGHVRRNDAKEDAGAHAEVALLEDLGLSRTSVVVDVGAGTGQFTNVDVVQAGFLTFVHRGDPADFVYCRYALHHLPDFWKALALERFHRTLRPGGVLRLWDIVDGFDPSEAEDRIEAWCATGRAGIDEDWSRGELEEHVRDEHSTFTWLLELMIERSGFTIDDATYSKDGIFAKYVARAT